MSVLALAKRLGYTADMRKAARAIIIEDGKLLVMRRDKHGDIYFTLVGGVVDDSESIEQALVREVKEETGLNVTALRLVYVEEHPAPYNEQYIYLCHIGPHADVAIQDGSEEGFMNRMNGNTHQPMWVDGSAFATLAFRTPQLQTAMLEAFRKGFPTQPVKLTDR